ncbi:hypothetical protein DFJ58DRAFT_837243 [Suillus subalutaceus]|uniref:uncharacterized protein n=1 Tax=Suillus subalutaceus TaxID=48586 RepID=UPI001B86BD32|nr:uncharacterized protein DFJ58DRAFT_837243 [Suillus subalutaceus]KAG1871279.1 hypothetical protein DFJ58DRAFT_837243 [Suillus subalutaceus]
MCPNILSFIYVLYVLHISCAARVIVKDTGTNYVPAQLNVDNLYKEVAPGNGWCGSSDVARSYYLIPVIVPAADIQDAFIRKYHLVEVDKNARLVLELPFLLTTAGNNRANEPESTPAVSFWKTKGMASKLSAIQRVEEPAPTRFSQQAGFGKDIKWEDFRLVNFNYLPFSVLYNISKRPRRRHYLVHGTTGGPPATAACWLSRLADEKVW